MKRNTSAHPFDQRREKRMQKIFGPEADPQDRSQQQLQRAHAQRELELNRQRRERDRAISSKLPPDRPRQIVPGRAR
ncbi:MAG: hypothetical protein QOH39_2763 [Verrucomicrobiota bacterium]